MMNWLTNIPISSSDVDRKRLANQKHTEEEIKAKVVEERAKKLESETYKSSYKTQSSLGRAADIAVFGFPMGLFR